MVNVHIDPSFDDEARREHLYRGDVMVYGAGPSTLGPTDADKPYEPQLHRSRFCASVRGHPTPARE